MRKLLLAVLASTLTVASFAPVALAQDFGIDTDFIDQEEIGTWSQDYIAVLVYLGVLEGYPDGTFKPKQGLTREEFAVALLEGLSVLEARLLDEQYYADEYLYNEIVNLQSQLFAALTQIDEIQAARLAEKNNFIGIQLNYTPDRDGDTSPITVEVNGKIQVIEISDQFAISIRPFVNSNTEVGAAATIDFDITDSLELYGGIGAAYKADENVTGALTGFDDGVVPYGNVGVSLDLSNKTMVYIDGKIPFDSKEGKEPTVGIGLGFKF